MCGIHALISPAISPLSQPRDLDSVSPELRRVLVARGPDHFGQACRKSNGWTLRFTSTVLALRGDHITRQPLESDNGSVLCWNGEAWRVNGQRIQAEANDAEVVLKLLVNVGSSAPGDERLETLLNALRAIEGPFAFVYYDYPAETLIYGRDRLGRRSLVLRQDGDELELCSVAGSLGNGWQEVEADGIYVARLKTQGGLDISRCPWIVGDKTADFVFGLGRFNKTQPFGNPQLTRFSTSVTMLKEQLLESIRLRILNIPVPPSTDGRTRLSVLFSGGLDCTVLARLCHEVLDPDQAIDLLNVAFENPRVVAQLKNGADGTLSDFYEACPDRITGRRSFAELQKVCPGRAFRFVAVNIPYAETLAHRQQVISLIYPHNTEMDLSIAYALYFAARGQGFCTDSSAFNTVPKPYTSPARVLLSGLGADELFGGYSRHLSAFQQRGYVGLVDELLLDVGRLGKRNLGRDDRVMSHWGKEVRFPFLDERLVRWAIETPSWEKCDFANGEDVTGVEANKRILRLLALELGMEGVAREKKRAIQFGSRTAKMESGRVKGTTLIS